MSDSTSRKVPPHSPEPIEALRARFTKAVQKTWTLAMMQELRGGFPPCNRFDFEDGARLVISLEVHDVGTEPLIHASLSSFKRAPMEKIPDARQALVTYWASLIDWPFVPDLDGIVISGRGHAHVWMPASMVMPQGGVA